MTLKGCILSYGAVQSLGHVGILMQAFWKDRAPDLNGKTGSWERLLNVAKIGHKKGPEPGYVAASISDFIGLWASATGDVGSIGTFKWQICPCVGSQGSCCCLALNTHCLVEFCEWCLS